jgi:hypothetical protein
MKMIQVLLDQFRDANYPPTPYMFRKSQVINASTDHPFLEEEVGRLRITYPVGERIPGSRPKRRISLGDCHAETSQFDSCERNLRRRKGPQVLENFAIVKEAEVT